MASSPPPGAGSPPNSQGSLALPRQRPTLALPNLKSRTSSMVQTPSALRQTSFPPEDTLEAQHARAQAGQHRRKAGGEDVGRFSDDESLDDFSDDLDVQSAIGDTKANNKKPRGEKRTRGRPPKNRGNSTRQGSASVLNGDEGKSTRRAGTAGAEDDQDADEEEDDEEEDLVQNTKDGFNVDMEEVEQERTRRYLFRESVHPLHQARYDSFHRVKLKTSDVRRLINATLSQSVPPNVVNVVMAYTKTFAGMLVEAAKEVQDEWICVEERNAIGEEGRPWKRLRMMQPEDSDEKDDVDEKTDESSRSNGAIEKGDNDRAAHEAGQVTAEKPASNSADVDAQEDTAMTDVVKTEPIEDKQNEPSSPSANGVVKTEQRSVSPKPITSIPTGSSTSPRPLQEASNTQQSLTQPNSSSNSTEAMIASESSSAPTATTQPSATTPPEAAPDVTEDLSLDPTSAAHIQPGAANLAKYIDEADRGPLLPDHLREALRRYRKSRDGGTVGFTGLSLEGRENAAVRMGGGRLFR